MALKKHKSRCLGGLGVVRSYGSRFHSAFFELGVDLINFRKLMFCEYFLISKLYGFIMSLIDGLGSSASRTILS